ncbi:hypothetical protein [Ornithinimicrobium kibberense]
MTWYFTGGLRSGCSTNSPTVPSGITSARSTVYSTAVMISLTCWRV